MKFRVLYRYDGNKTFHTETGEEVEVRRSADVLDSDVTIDEAVHLRLEYLIAFNGTADVWIEEDE